MKFEPFLHKSKSKQVKSQPKTTKNQEVNTEIFSQFLDDETCLICDTECSSNLEAINHLKKFHIDLIPGLLVKSEKIEESNSNLTETKSQSYEKNFKNQQKYQDENEIECITFSSDDEMEDCDMDNSKIVKTPKKWTR